MLSDPRATKYSHPIVPLLCAVYFLGLPLAAHADSATYTYTGNAFTNCYNAYAGTCANDTVSITLAAPLGDNLNAANITASITAFSFSDRSGLKVNPSNALFGFFYVSTDSSGNITQWSGEAGVCTDPSCSASDFVVTDGGLVRGTPVSVFLDFATVNYPTGNPCITFTSFDATACSLLDTAYVFSNPGTWTVSTPEPSTMLMLGSGLIGLLLLGFRLNTHGF